LDPPDHRIRTHREQEREFLHRVPLLTGIHLGTSNWIPLSLSGKIMRSSDRRLPRGRFGRHPLPLIGAEVNPILPLRAPDFYGKRGISIAYRDSARSRYERIRARIAGKARKVIGFRGDRAPRQMPAIPYRATGTLLEYSTVVPYSNRLSRSATGAGRARLIRFHGRSGWCGD